MFTENAVWYIDVDASNEEEAKGRAETTNLAGWKFDSFVGLDVAVAVKQVVEK